MQGSLSYTLQTRPGSDLKLGEDVLPQDVRALYGLIAGPSGNAGSQVILLRPSSVAPSKDVTSPPELDLAPQMGRCLKERLRKEDKGGHIVLESIIFCLQYKAGPQGALLNPKGGARFAIDGRLQNKHKTIILQVVY